MPPMIQVVLVTGFLGSGKTTFLNQVIGAFSPDSKLTVLMNEFAEIGVDAALIDRRDHLDVIEVRKGSIFCVCAKKEFIRGLTQIADQIGPDYLLIEATGVANPADIKKDLALDLFKGRFHFLRQICLIDTLNFEAAYHVYAAVERQIATSDIFVLNKADLVDAAQKQTVRQLIAAHHRAPVFIEAVNAKVPLERLWAPLGLDEPVAADNTSSQPIESSIKELEALRQGPAAGQLPPDRMVSLVYAWQGHQRVELTHSLEKLPLSLPRAKGFVKLDGVWTLVDGVMGRYRFSPAGKAITDLPPALRNRLVVITTPETLDWVERALGPPLFVCQSQNSPFTSLDLLPMG